MRKEHEVNVPECLRRDGEHEPEEEPEKWVDRVKTPEDASAKKTRR